MSDSITCPFCGGKAISRRGDFVYGDPYRHLSLWVCENFPKCDAYVGCHKGSGRPLGTLADRATRDARSSLHGLFDPIWKSGKFTRTKAYAHLAMMMNLPRTKCHIAMFDLETCKKAEKIAIILKHGEITGSRHD